MKKKTIIIILISIILLLIGGITFFLLTKEKKDDYKYVIYYNDMGTPGNNYDIYVNEDYSLKIIHQPCCSTVECMEGTYYPESKTYEINYNDSNKERLKEFINELFKDNNTNELDTQNINLTERQLNIFNMITIGDEYWFQIVTEKYKYSIEYEKDNNVYYIFVKNDKLINVNKLTFNEDYNITKIDSFNINFNEKNKKIIDDFISYKFKDSESNQYIANIDNLTKTEISIIESIINNDQSLITIDKFDTKKILFTLSSNSRVNCPTGILKVYDNKTYEYVFAYNEDGELTREGSFTYNIDKLLSNLSNFNPNEREPFTLEYPGGVIVYIYDNNEIVMEFLNEINIKLDSCLGYGE